MFLVSVAGPAFVRLLTFEIVSRVMRNDVYTLQASGMSVRDVGMALSILNCRASLERLHLEDTLSSTNVKGFPVVSAHSRTLLGYIGRTEIRYVFGRRSAYFSIESAL
jgi:hypothetical protein